MAESGRAARVGRWRFVIDRCSMGAAVAIVVFLSSWAFGQWFFSRSANEASYDSVIYHGYGVAMRAGQMPYRDFSVAYPPGALPMFVAPTYVVATRDVSGYQKVFASLMAGCGVLCLVFVLASRPPRRAVAFVAVSPLLIGPLVASRFDLWPTALVAGAVAAFLRDRHSLGWGALGAAFAAKLFAFVLIPIALFWTLRRAGPRALRRGLASWTIVTAAAFGPFAALAPHGLWESLRDQVSRAIQIESLPGALLTTLGHPAEIISVDSVSIAGHHTFVAVSTVVEIAVLLALWIGFSRGEMEPNRLVRYIAACVCAFIALGKVLSPQYLIWLVPLVPLVRGGRGLVATGLLSAALLATQWYFPSHYPSVIDFHLAWFVLLRDLVLIGLLAALGLPTLKALRSE